MNEKLLPLKDFHLPPEPGIWPLAPGWWALLALLLILGATLTWLVRRHQIKAKRNYRKEAKQRLTEIIDQYQQDDNLQRLSMHTNQLLKQIALNAVSPQAARLIDDPWVAFLNNQLVTTDTPLSDDTNILLSKQPYTSKALLTPVQTEAALEDVKHWIDHHQGALLDVNL
ncbi:hypothetical protein R50072_16000 [Simiduia litorea]|uniref:DUF4381 domain-containing protein n=1 Tax=Simiduia litorea TaxID=1435348 RepID=UPI0036F1A045